MGYLQKEGLQPNLDTPKTILIRNSTYKICTKTTELPKLRTFTGRTPTLLWKYEGKGSHIQLKWKSIYTVGKTQASEEDR